MKHEEKLNSWGPFDDISAENGESIVYSVNKELRSHQFELSRDLEGEEDFTGIPVTYDPVYQAIYTPWFFFLHNRLLQTLPSIPRSAEKAAT